MFDPFKKLKLAGAFLGAPDDAGVGAAENLDIPELFGRLHLKDLRAMTLQADALLDQPGVRALFESRYLPEPEPLDRLADMGDGTLGVEYVRYMRANKLQQHRIQPRFEANDPASYLAERVRRTHAILHVLTEYDASPLGELALQAYYVAQLGNLISGVIIASGILQISRDNPELLGPALEVTSEAYQRGRLARSFLGIAWEELWSAQVPQLRELAEIPPRSSSVALLRFEEDAPRPRSSGFSGFSGVEDGLAALGRSASRPNPSARVFSFSEPEPAPEPPKPEPEAPRPSQRPSSSSSLLASFMALSEEAEKPAAPAPEPQRPEPPRLDLPRNDRPRELPRELPRLRLDATSPRSQAKPPPPPPPRPVVPPSVAPVVPEPAYKVEEAAKHITPALSPDDPDYF